MKIGKAKTSILGQSYVPQEGEAEYYNLINGFIASLRNQVTDGEWPGESRERAKFINSTLAKRFSAEDYSVIKNYSDTRSVPIEEAFVIWMDFKSGNK